jgi:glutathione synthase
MRIGFLIGRLTSQQPTYSGIHLAWAAHCRGHEVCFVSAEDLSFLDDGTVFATTLRVRAGDYARPSDFQRALLSDDAVREDDTLSGMDVMFIRYNPLREPPSAPPSPVLDFCWRLRLDGTFVVNDPEGVYRAWGRMYLADLPPDTHARTLVSRSPEEIKAFLRGLESDAVLRPFAHAGREKVFRVPHDEVKNLNVIITAITKVGYVLAQEYIEEAEEGERRILLLNGDPMHIDGRVAIYRRLPRLTEGRRRRTGSKRQRCSFGPIEERICELLRPKLLADDLYLVSVDLAGGKILELGVFSPGGIHSLREIYRMDVATAVIADLERRVRLRATYRNTHDPEAAGVV